jgi:hypothetical protein
MLQLMSSCSSVMDSAGWKILWLCLSCALWSIYVWLCNHIFIVRCVPKKSTPWITYSWVLCTVVLETWFCVIMFFVLQWLRPQAEVPFGGTSSCISQTDTMKEQVGVEVHPWIGDASRCWNVPIHIVNIGAHWSLVDSFAWFGCTKWGFFST